MDILNPRSLRQQADRALARGRDPKKLILCYAGISLGLSLLGTFANLWLDDQISGTGGLGNMGTRAIFSTAQTIIPFVIFLASLCLDLGYLSGALRISRGQYADHTDLKVGLQKFWPLMRLTMLQMLIYLAVAVLSAQIAGIIFSMTPWAAPLLDALQSLSTADLTALDEATLMNFMSLMGPMYILLGIVYLIVLIPFLHRMRMAHYCLLDDPRGRAMASIRSSFRMMRSRFFPMLKIDLSLWLYYAATVLVTVLMWTDAILLALGIPLPMDATLFSLLVYLAAVALQFVVQITLRNRVSITYALVYEQLREKPENTGPVVLGNIFDM